MSNSVRESSDSRDGSLCESSLNNSPAERRERIARIAKELIEKHFAMAHTDMVGDDDERRGYLKGVIALKDAILSSDLVGTGSEETPLAKRDRA